MFGGAQADLSFRLFLSPDFSQAQRGLPSKRPTFAFIPAGARWCATPRQWLVQDDTFGIANQCSDMVLFMYDD
jgi:hypothetical protein